MALNVWASGGTIVYQFTEYLDNCFLLKSDAGDEVAVKTPLLFDLSDKGKEYDIYFLAKKNIKESDIYQFYHGPSNKRIGWIIPVISLDSKDHEYAYNPHFLKYAYAGSVGALELLNDSVYSRAVYDGNDLTFSDIFHEATVLLVISKETLVDGVDFDIEKAYPGLIGHGYVKLSSFNPEDITLQVDIDLDIRLNIEFVSNEIHSYSLINELLNFSLAYERKAVFKFFYLYQIIELLIDSVFKCEQQILVDKLLTVKEDSAKTKDVIEEISRFVSERKRMSLLFKNYCKIDSALAEIKRLCNQFLSKIGRDQCEELSDYLYSIRNFIFHQYRDYPSAEESLLNEIVVEMLYILPFILSSYKKPTSNV